MYELAELVYIFWPVVVLLIVLLLIIRKKLKNNIEILDEEIKKEKNKNLSRYIILSVAVLIIVQCVWGVYVIVAGTMSAEKPMIYLYPTSEQEIEVKLGNEDKLTCTYPKYENSWNVLAKPNGDIIDLKTGRNLYGLYWEGKSAKKSSTDEGFVIKGEDTIGFLEEKLEILGLTEREANEFIVYWLPRLEKNKYNFIRFETIEEITENMPLEVTPAPDSVIRVMMEYKPLTKYKEVKEQELITPSRQGFTVVEWGGCEIK